MIFRIIRRVGVSKVSNTSFRKRNRNEYCEQSIFYFIFARIFSPLSSLIWSDQYNFSIFYNISIISDDRRYLRTSIWARSTTRYMTTVCFIFKLRFRQLWNDSFLYVSSLGTEIRSPHNFTTTIFNCNPTLQQKK